MGKAQLGVMDESDWWTVEKWEGCSGALGYTMASVWLLSWRGVWGLWVVHGFSFSGLQARMHLFLCRRNCPINR